MLQAEVLQSITSPRQHSQREQHRILPVYSLLMEPLPGQMFALGMAYGEDDDESGRLDAFNSLVTTCFGVPSKPNSCQAHGSETMPSNADGFGGLFSPPPPHVQTPTPVCACLQKQAVQLSQLRAVEQRQPSVQLDTMLHYTSLTMQSSEKILQCGACRNDVQVLLTTTMVFQTVLRWAESLCHGEGTPGLELDVSVGRYVVSGAETGLIKDLLISRVFGRSKQVLDLLRARVKQAAPGSGPGGGSPQLPRSADTEYLQHSCQTLIRTLVRISKHLHLLNAHGLSCSRGGT